MAGYKQLAESDIVKLLSQDNKIATQVAVLYNEDTREEFQYLFRVKTNPENKERDYVTVISPCKAAQEKALIANIRRKYHRPHILLTIIGQGVTEEHIIAAYITPSNHHLYIDSKSSIPRRFFASTKKLASPLTLFKSIYSSLQPNAREVLSKNFSMEMIGTQSVFDGVSCGYHAAHTILVCEELLNANRSPTRENIIDKMKNPFVALGDSLQNLGLGDKLKVDFGDFIHQAWLNTYLPLGNKNSKTKITGVTAFMNWPAESRQKIAYLLTAGFLLYPLINVCKIPTEFLINLLAEVANYVKNQLISLAPTNFIVQYMRSVLMLTAILIQGLFKVAYWLIRLITSPITAAKAAYAINPILGVMSILISLAIYGVLIYFAAPVVASALAGIATAAALALQPVIIALAFPLVQLLALGSFTVSPITAALTTLIISALGLYGARSALVNGIDYCAKPRKSEKEDFSFVYDESDAEEIEIKTDPDDNGWGLTTFNDTTESRDFLNALYKRQERATYPM